MHVNHHNLIQIKLCTVLFLASNGKHFLNLKKAQFRESENKDLTQGAIVFVLF